MLGVGDKMRTRKEGTPVQKEAARETTAAVITRTII